MANWVPVILGEPRKLGTPPTSKIARIAALYSCRVPIINGLLLLLLPAICLALAPTLLKNLLVMTPGNMFWSTAAAYVFSWSIQVSYRVIAINRGERLFLPGPAAARP